MRITACGKHVSRALNKLVGDSTEPVLVIKDHPRWCEAGTYECSNPGVFTLHKRNKEAQR